MLEQGAVAGNLQAVYVSGDYKKPSFVDFEIKGKLSCTELEERLVIVTASVKTLKQKIITEKELWRSEIKKTIDLEKKVSEYDRQRSVQGGDNYNHFQIITSAFLKNQTQIQNEINGAFFKQQILEAESMCNLEMLKIKNSLECLAPLQAIIMEWNAGIEEIKRESK